MSTINRINLIMELFILESGKARSAMDTVCRFGLMVPNTRANGSKTRPMGKASSIMPRVMSMTANGKMTRPMVTVSTNTQMDQGMRVTGETTSSMAKVQSNGPMAQSTKGFTRTG